MNRGFNIVLSLFLLAEGIWGLFSPVVFGVLSTNIFHAVIHLLLGIWGITWGVKRNPKTYCSLVGGLLLLVGILYFIPGTGLVLMRWFNMNQEVAYLNICLGLLALLVAQVGHNRVVAH